jgi:tRNA dimethylallyltransferase
MSFRIKKLVLITGPTASGKSDLAVEMALREVSPVISCDSRQIYKELRIGTAPPTPEQLSAVKHYFIFSHSIQDHYTAGKYETEALALLDKLFRDHDTLIMAGGSGLYADAVCRGIDNVPPPDLALRDELMNRLKCEGLDSLRRELKIMDRESYESIDLANPRRVVRALEVILQTGEKYSSIKKNSDKKRGFEIEKVYIDLPRDMLYSRINSRVDRMMEMGLLEEVKGLMPFRNLPALKTVGYSELFDYLDGKNTLEEAVELIKRNTRRYAKRQITWWRRTRQT